MKHIKLFESFITEGKKKKDFSKVKVGDIAMENPDGSGSSNEELGEILWVGTYDELLKSEYKRLINDWDEDSIEFAKEENQLVVIDTDGFDGGPTLFGYDSDPSSCVVFESVEPLNEASIQDKFKDAFMSLLKSNTGINPDHVADVVAEEKHLLVTMRSGDKLKIELHVLTNE